MSQKKQLSILEFSRLTGITRDNLRFYDRIGLLKPEIRGKTVIATIPGTSWAPPT